MTSLQQVRIAVYDDDRVIDDHSEHEDECRQSDGIQFNTGNVHQADTDSGADRYTCRSHEGGTQREEEQHHRDDDEYRNDDIAQEREHGVIDHFRLVGDTMEADIGRQDTCRLGEFLIHLFSKRHYIMLRHHLHVEYQTRSTVELDILLGCLVAPFDGRNVFEPDSRARDRVGPDDLLLQFVLRLVRNDHLQRTVRRVVPGDGAQSLQRQLSLQHGEVNAIPRQLFGVDSNSYLFGLLPHDTQLTHLGNRAQRGTHLLGVLLQLARTAFIALHGNEQR